VRNDVGVVDWRGDGMVERGRERERYPNVEDERSWRWQSDPASLSGLSNETRVTITTS